MTRIERFRRRGARSDRAKTRGGWFITNRSTRRREQPYRFDKVAFLPCPRRRARPRR